MRNGSDIHHHTGQSPIYHKCFSEQNPANLPSAQEWVDKGLFLRDKLSVGQATPINSNFGIRIFHFYLPVRGGNLVKGERGTFMRESRDISHLVGSPSGTFACVVNSLFGDYQSPKLTHFTYKFVISPYLFAASSSIFGCATLCVAVEDRTFPQGPKTTVNLFFRSHAL